MISIKFAIIYDFERTRELRKDGTARILIRAYQNTRCKYFNTGIYVKPHQWDDKNKRIVRHPNQFKLNKAFQSQLEKMEAFVLTLQENKEPVTLDRLGDYNNSKPIKSFTAFFEHHLENSKLSIITYRGQRQTIKKLTEYRGPIYFNQIDYNLIHGFDTFLLSEKGLKVNTVAKHHKNLKKYINLAIRYGYFERSKNPYQEFKVKTEPSERIYLTESELRIFESIEIPESKEHLKHIRDFFLFSCYTGLRFSDISQLTRGNVLETDNGTILYFRSKKTKKPYNQNLRKLFKIEGQELSKPEKILLEKLNFHKSFFGDDPHYKNTSLFGITNQYLNRELKKLAQLMPVRDIIKKKLSIHSGRHTFGTIMIGKVDVEIVQLLMQHSKLKETMIYVHLNPKAVNKALDGVKW